MFKQNVGSWEFSPGTSQEPRKKMNMKLVQRRKTHPEVISQLTPPACRSDRQTLYNFHGALAPLAVEKGCCLCGETSLLSRGGGSRKDTQGVSEQALTGWFLRQFQGHEK